MDPWRAIFNPSALARKWLRKEDGWSLKTKLELDWFSQPGYAYCLNQACTQAKRLGIDAVSAIEFGVGAGVGLAAIEAIADALATENGIAIHAYGFDVETRSASSDPRDLPYARSPEPRKLDRAAIEAKVKHSTLIIGDISAAPANFFDTFDPPPIGFVSFNVGDYTSTAEALRLFDAPAATRLPRTFCYFEGIIGTDDELHGECVGPLLAIEEFNHSPERLKLARIHGLKHKRIFQSAWTEQVFVLHDLAHPRYADRPKPPAAPNDADEGRP